MTCVGCKHNQVFGISKECAALRDLLESMLYSAGRGGECYNYTSLRGYMNCTEIARHILSKTKVQAVKEAWSYYLARTL